MIVRPFEWRDLPALYRYRDQGVYLDSALVLTRGAWPLPGALLSYLAPGLGVFTWVGRENEVAAPLFGQMMHLTGAQGAHSGNSGRADLCLYHTPGLRGVELKWQHFDGKRMCFDPVPDGCGRAHKSPGGGYCHGPGDGQR
jgi:hypothetical protein